MSDDYSDRKSPSADDSDPSGSESVRPPRDQGLLHQAGDVLENLRSQLAELDRREQHVAAQTTALEQERRILRLSSQEFDDQMQQREAAFAERETSLHAQLDDVASAQQEIAAEQSRLQQTHEEVEAARETYRENVLAELDEDRGRLEQERSEFEQKLADHQQQWQAGLAKIEASLEQERETRQSALEADLQQLEQMIAEKEAAWEQEQASRREQAEAEAAQKLADLRSELDAVREEQLGEIERREQGLHRKQVDLEKRTRFHERHLEQLRSDLEKQQADLDRRKQQSQCEQVQTAEHLDRQRHHLLRYRDRLLQREESLHRERHLLGDATQALELKQSEEAALSHQQRAAWNDESQALRADIRRQQDMLTLHAQNLEARRSRLDELRDDLEETHRETLELRLVVEQVWAQLSQTFGEEATRVRVEQARTELLSGYESSRESVVEQQQAIVEAETRLEEQREKFRHEREEFARWMDEREQQLQAQEQSLQREIEAVTESETQWRTTRERWTLEKIEAESVIRQLLEELDADLTLRQVHQAPDEGQDSLPTGVDEASISEDETSAAA